MIKEAIQALAAGKSLSYEEAYFVMGEIMTGEASPAQMGAVLTALSIKGETADEIAGLASVMRNKATHVNLNGIAAIDIVGTGGDGSNSINVSTAAALVAAGAGLKVAKHGNKSATSQCGSADVLTALGVEVSLPAEAVSECVQKVGIGFMFAPAFHPAMKYAAPVRRELGIRTVFNILGPLTNPAGVEHILLGVASEKLVDKMAEVLCRLGTKHGMVIHGKEGLDEISISGKTMVREITNNKVTSSYDVTPESFGLKKANAEGIKGGTAEENAATIMCILDGEKGTPRDIVVLNAAAALIAGDLTKDRKEAVKLAEDSIDSMQAKDVLERLVVLTQRLGKHDEDNIG
jgi:anthranilate phosphoribosyltransferase